GKRGGGGGREQDVGRGGVIADYERDLAGGTRRGGEAGEVDARDGRRGHAPRRRHRPVAAVHQPGVQGAGVREAGRLRLRQGGRRADGGDLAGSVALVVANTVDVDGVRSEGGAVDLERDRLTHVHADVCGKALDPRVTRVTVGCVPDRRSGARQLVLTGDGIDQTVHRVGGDGLQRQAGEEGRDQSEQGQKGKSAVPLQTF